MDALKRDFGYVLRSLRRSPGFFVVTALTLALGIGATTAIFSVVYGVLLRPLPYPRAARIVQLLPIDKTGRRTSASEPNVEDWEARSRDFSSMAIWNAPSLVTVNGVGEPVRARGVWVTRGFFSVVALAPEAGRTFAESELRTGAAPTVVVSHAFAAKYLGGSGAAVGRSLSLGSRLVTVIGVMPPAMDLPAGNDLWLPREIEEPSHSRTSGGWRVVARLRDGISVDQARRDLSALSRSMKAEYGEETWMSDADVTTLHDQLTGNVRPTLLVLLGASAFLLLIACANVVNLLVARHSTRRAEIGVRLALGASRRRIVQQFLAESFLLAAAGGVGGIALAAAGVRGLLALQDGRLPRAGEIHLDGPVVLFAIGVAGGVSMALGLLTAWQGSRGEIRASLSASQRTLAGSRPAARIRQSLVVSQLALTVVLLTGAAVLARSFLSLMAVHPGYRTSHAVILDATLPSEQDSSAPRRRAAFYGELIARVAAVPGVGAAGGANGVPLIGGAADGAFVILSSPDEHVAASDYPKLWADPTRSGYANFVVVDGGYFRAMDIPVLRGRGFRAGDAPDAPPVGVISASLAAAKWPNEDPIGKLIQYGNMDGDLRPFTIVGVVGDVRDENLASPPQPTFYAYLAQRPRAAHGLHVVMQTPGDPAPVMAAARAIVRELRPDVPVAFRTMETVVATSVADRRFSLTLVGVLGAAALLLAMLGVYSVISYLVTQRRQEIGVRIALGAQRADVLALVLRRGALLAAVGIVMGVAGALAATRLLQGLVYGVRPTDPLAFAMVIALLAAVALAASWLPARRAARVDPMEVLRAS